MVGRLQGGEGGVEENLALALDALVLADALATAFHAPRLDSAEHPFSALMAYGLEHTRWMDAATGMRPGVLSSSQPH